MINKTLTYVKSKDEVFKCFLKSAFANSIIGLTKLEVEILDEVRKNRRGFDSKLISTNLGISVQSLNNYKSKLVKKQLLIKATDNRYYVNSIFSISNTDKEGMSITLNFKFVD